MSTTNYNCDQCGKPCTAKTVIYNRYKTHFCGKECKADHQRGAKDRAKDERIRELEEMCMHEVKTKQAWKADFERLSDRYSRVSSELYDKSVLLLKESQRISRLRVLAWVGWIGCIVYVAACLYANNGWHLPTTKPDAGELVVGMQGESRTPHIAYVDSLGEWRDADNGERLEVTKWSRP